MTELWNRFARDEEGATAIEYALIASLLAVIAIASMRALGAAMSEMYGSIETAVVTAS